MKQCNATLPEDNGCNQHRCGRITITAVPRSQWERKEQQRNKTPNIRQRQQQGLQRLPPTPPIISIINVSAANSILLPNIQQQHNTQQCCTKFTVAGECNSCGDASPQWQSSNNTGAPATKWMQQPNANLGLNVYDKNSHGTDSSALPVGSSTSPAPRSHRQQQRNKTSTSLPAPPRPRSTIILFWLTKITTTNNHATI